MFKYHGLHASEFVLGVYKIWPVSDISLLKKEAFYQINHDSPMVSNQIIIIAIIKVMYSSWSKELQLKIIDSISKLSKIIARRDSQFLYWISEEQKAEVWIIQNHRINSELKDTKKIWIDLRDLGLKPITDSLLGSLQKESNENRFNIASKFLQEKHSSRVR